jgi:hypothetical protein
VLNKPILTLKISLSKAPRPQSYTGYLIVTHNEKEQPPEKIVLKYPPRTPERLAQLTAEPQAHPLYHTLSFLETLGVRDHKLPEISITLHEEAGMAPAKGITISATEVEVPEGVSFLPTRQVEWLWRGNQKVDLWQSSTPDGNSSLRSVPAKNQIKLVARFLGLDPGLYKLKFKLNAENLQASPPPIAVTVKVRDSVGYAFLILLVAIAISYFGTKTVFSIRRRGEVIQRIRDIRKDWLSNVEPYLPVVAIRALLQQAGERIAPFIPPAVDLIDERLTKAEQMVTPVGRIRQIQQTIDTWGQPEMITRRVSKALRKLAGLLHPDDASKELCSEIDTELATLQRELTSSGLKDYYWAHLKGDIDNLLTNATQEKFADAHWDTVELLRTRVRVPAPPNTIEEAAAIENDYAKLKLLWEKREDDVLMDALITWQERFVDQMFDVVDDAAWNKLKEANADSSWLQSPRVTGPEPLRANQLITFKLKPIPPELGDNFLFKHGLTYEWTITHSQKKSAPKQLLNIENKEPQLFHYVSEPGWIDVSVVLHRGPAESLGPISLLSNARISRSREFGALTRFQTAEVLSLCIALVLASLTGMQALYFKNATFGSLTDYVALALWGFGTDQAKNFIQLLRPNIIGR